MSQKALSRTREAPEYKRVFFNPLRQIGNHKMNTIFSTTSIAAIIEASTLASEIKAELKDLARQILEAQDEEAKALKDIYSSKASVNERQYSKRLSEPMSAERRNEVLIEQFAYRNWFANAVLRTSEVRRLLQSLTKQVETKVSEIAAQGKASNIVALLTMLKLARSNDYSAPDEILSEFNKVSGVSGDRIREAVYAIFSSKKSGSGVFCQRNFTASPLQFAEPNAVQIELKVAVDAAMLIREKCERLRFNFTDARSKNNLPQFTQRMEQAHAGGEDAKIATIAREKSNAEAALFIAASLYEAAHGKLVLVVAELAKAIEAAASAVGDGTTIVGLKEMSNCLGAWKWLGELTGYTENNYRSCNPSKALADLEFDSAAYVKS